MRNILSILIFLWCSAHGVKAQFEEHEVATARQNREFMAVFDTDGDGILEMMARDVSSDAILLLFQGKDQNYQQETTMAVSGRGWTYISTEDIDGDGYTDAVVYREEEKDISWLKNLGNGAFAASLTPIASLNQQLAWQEDMLVQDIDQDGLADIVVRLEDRLAWYQNRKDQFSEQKTLVSMLKQQQGEYSHAAMKLLDLNQDHEPEIILLSEQSIHFAFRQSETFVWKTDKVTDKEIGAMFLADINQDTYPDLLFTEKYVWTGVYPLWYIANDQQGNFPGKPVAIHQDFFDTHVLHQAADISAQDIDRDGDMDLLLQTRPEGCEEEDAATVLGWIENREDWHSPTFHRIAPGVQARSFADLEGDGDIDIIATDRQGIYYYENTRKANKAPQDILLSDSTVAENLPAGTQVGTLSAVDADDTHRYALVAGEGSQGNKYFSIDSNSLQTRQVLLREQGSRHTIRLRATDSQGLYLEKNFDILVMSPNHPPVLVHAIGEQKVGVGETYLFVVPDTVFHDADAEDSLLYSASLQHGDPLPAWLTFDEEQRVFSGTPAYADTLAVQLTVRDLQGDSAVSVFTLIAEQVTAIPNEVHTGDVIVYPNPVRDKMLLIDAVNTGQGTLHYSLWDLKGSLLMQGKWSMHPGKPQFLDLRALPAGEYLIELRAGAYRERKKILIP